MIDGVPVRPVVDPVLSHPPRSCSFSPRKLIPTQFNAPLTTMFAAFRIVVSDVMSLLQKNTDVAILPAENRRTLT